MYNKQAQMKNSFILFTQMCALWQNESLGNIVKAPDIQNELQYYEHHQNLGVLRYYLLPYIVRFRFLIS